MQNKNKLKILFYDCETRPVRFWAWKTGEQYLSHDQIIKGDSFDIITICWKWLGEKKVHSLDWGLDKQDSSKMIDAFSKVIESADLVVAHNGDRFDLKQVNTQRLLKGQSPVAWPSSEDTLKQFKKHFAFPSYRLDYLSKMLLATGKDIMTFQDWIDIVQYKKPKALAKMIKYCKKDVRMLEGIYNKAKSFFTPKIHAGVVKGSGKDTCPRCGSCESRSKGIAYTKTGRYRRRWCKNCYTVYKGGKL